ncbi:MAG: DmsC/YnfH family molybdoenzyme membrane anchor subunit [Chloroflexota bacterium]
MAAKRSPGMAQQYAFQFDSSACSGCKACQIACKDKHNLPLGLRWRRVYEISGGEWQQVGPAWQPQVFAYNLSIACNHCLRPICIEVCPAAAISKRPDGIVLIDPGRCLGCQYCSWACPYGALQYDPGSGRMTKCTFCADELDMGRPPACVAACPLRVLDFTVTTSQPASAPAQVVIPLPEARLTQPALQLSPHPHACQAPPASLQLANREEVQSDVHNDECPLVLFTLLAQASAGAFTTAAILQAWLARRAGPLLADQLTWLAVLLAGLALGLSLLISLLHLGRPTKAYRALANLRASWLSREILFAGLSAGCWVIYVGLHWLSGSAGEFLRLPLLGITSLCGLGLVYSMARVYRQRTIPAWNTWQTTASFFMSAASLGSLSTGVALALACHSLAIDNRLAVDSLRGLAIWATLFLILETAALLTFRSPASPNRGPRLACLLGGLLLTCAIVLKTGTWQSLVAAIAFGLALCLALASAIQGRLDFYAARGETAL